MAGLTPVPEISSRAGAFSALAKRQYAAMIWVQSRIFLNSFRTLRGGFELGARVLSIAFFFVISIGPAIGMGFTAYHVVSRGHTFGIAVLLWIVFLVWQFFTAFSPAIAGQNPDLTHLLRFPVGFGSWMLLYLVYGIASPSTLIGVLWTVGIGTGISIARPSLFLSTALTLAIFVLFNILLSRAILSWIERIMARRRTRELVTGALLVFALAGQALNPALHQHRHRTPFGLRISTIALILHRARVIQSYLPPGCAADSVAAPPGSDIGAVPLAGLALYALAAGCLLGVRLRAESLGENLSEAPRRSVIRSTAARERGRRLLDFPGPVAAVFEKDLRYLMRSGPMLYALAAPLVMVFVFGGAIRSSSMSGIRAAYALPLGIVWAFMGLTQLVSNNFGIEGHGVQFYFLSPTPLRTIVLAKNAMHLALFALEAILITGIVIYRFGPPAPSMALATLAWILFAVPLYFTAGNLFSILMPYRVNMTRMRRQEFSLGNGLSSMLAQSVILGIGAAVMLPCAAFGREWLATPILLALAGVSIAVYLAILARIDRFMDSHRESLVRDIAK